MIKLNPARHTMKTLSFISLVLIMVTFQNCSQNPATEDLPESVKNSFTQKFPQAENVVWGKESETEWEAEFILNGISYSANFLQSGDWVESEYEIEAVSLPENIKTVLDENFSDYEISKIEITETSEGSSYEFEIEEGEEEFEVVIDAQGKLTKTNESEEDEDDEKAEQ